MEISKRRPINVTLIAMGCFLLSAYSTRGALLSIDKDRTLSFWAMNSAIISVAIGVGLLQLLKWARIFMLIRCAFTFIFALARFNQLIHPQSLDAVFRAAAVGFCIYAFVYLMREETALLFGAGGPTSNPINPTVQ
jgi:hypothetical protein